MREGPRASSRLRSGHLYKLDRLQVGILPLCYHTLAILHPDAQLYVPP